MEFPARLWTYFGVVGILSILTWLTALVVLARYARHRRRYFYFSIALGIALAGRLLTWWNSERVSAIHVEAPPLAAETAPAEEKDKEKGGGADQGESARTEPRAAEPKGDATDAATTGAADDKAGAGAAGPGDGGAPAADGKTAAPKNREYEYKKRGRRRRHLGVTDPQDGKKTGRFSELTQVVKDAPQADAFTLPEADVERANRYDRLNLFGARFTMWLALFAVIADYIRRFNSTTECILPLPMPGWLVDTFSPQTSSVCFADGERDELTAYMERAVRKGETFLYFGPGDPWPSGALPRVSAPIGTLTKLVHGAGDPDLDVRMLLESAWFDRYCFVIVGDDRSREMLRDLTAFLTLRRKPRARARRTVNLVCDLDAPLTPDEIRPLIQICKDRNYKFVMAAPAERVEEIGDLFEEVIRERP